MRSLLTLLLTIPSLFAEKTLPLFPDDLANWKMAGPGEFNIQDNIATAKGGMGLWWFSGEQYSNATLSLEFKLDDAAYNSGIFVRFPDPGNDPWVAVKQGYEIQISGRGKDYASTGAIYKLQAPAKNNLRKDGEWNHLEIHTIREFILVVLNGTHVNQFKTEKGRGDKAGYFGIQNHDDNSPVQFRNISVTPLDSKISLQDVLPKGAQNTYQALLNASAKKEEWYDHADFGPAFVQTWGDFYQNTYRSDAALKGILQRPDLNNPELVTLFNTETLQLVTASQSGVALDNTPFKGAHGSQNKILNLDNLFNNALSPAWANAEGAFADTRANRGHGNFEHMDFHGYYRHGRDIILSYSVHGTPVLEKIVATENGLRRILQIDGHEGSYRLRPITAPSEESSTEHPSLTITTGAEGTIWELTNREQALIAIDYQAGGATSLTQNNLPDLAQQTQGGPALSNEIFDVTPQLGKGKAPFLVDQIPLPPTLENSPYKNKVRITDFDFFADGDRAAACTWDGDVWLLSGLKEFQNITWKRFASGLFEPLGLKIVNDIIHLNCRDGIWQVHDLNDDNEADHYQVFNYDVLITNNFHEFSFGLETDSEGNFYFAKAAPVRAGGRNFEKILAHNGTVLKLSPDGKNLSVVGTGLRAPGGIGVGPNGELTTGENEGTWQPCCKINYFTQEQRPAFLGTEPARQGVPTDFHEPLCYLPMTVDNSGGGQVWVPENAKLGLKPHELLHLSYGQSSIYRVLSQEIDNGGIQGGVIKLPIKLSSSAQRATFHPDGSMYVVGMRGWQTNAAQEAGIQRVRYKEGVPLLLPEAMNVSGNKLTLTFDTELDEELATDPESFALKRWKYIRGPQYGSGQFSIDNPDLAAEENALKQESKGHRKHDRVEVTAAELGKDGKTITLTIPSLKPAQQMQIEYDLEDTSGEVLVGTIYSTIHQN